MSIQKKRDWTRRAVHVAFGACALFVPVFGRWPSVAVAAAAVAYNGLIAPRMRLDRAYRREGEGHLSGLTTYPLAVLFVLLLFPMPVAMGAWGILAVADPFAAVAGTLCPRPRFPGNPRKSLVGTLAGFLVAAPVCFLLLAYAGRPDMYIAAAVAALVAVAVEGLRLPIDDNLPVAFAAAGALMVMGV